MSFQVSQNMDREEMKKAFETHWEQLCLQHQMNKQTDQKHNDSLHQLLVQLEYAHLSQL